MKVIIFDVGNAACSVISSPNNIGMMIDCGSNNDKSNPVDLYKNQKNWLNVNQYINSFGNQYELGMLHITHPDDDHVRNAKRIREELTPYISVKRENEEFPDSDRINDDYKTFIDKDYRETKIENISWGFDVNRAFMIPMDIIKKNDTLSTKLRNNSSILRFIEYKGIRILYCGDMESAGWEWLIENDKSFLETVKKGVDVLIAPHHGHKSGFPNALFDHIPNVKCVIHSKGSEGNIEGSDVSNKYSEKADGIIYKNLNDKKMYNAKVLTTRSNGDIYIEITNSNFHIWATKASSNHSKA